MTHQNIQLDDYHQGDALKIPLVVDDSEGTRQDITGADVEWLLKEDELDTDASAILHKSTDVNVDSEQDVEITDAANGEATVTIHTGDTDGVLDDAELGTLQSDDFHHRARVTDADGNRSTIFHGTFTIHV